MRISGADFVMPVSCDFSLPVMSRIRQHFDDKYIKDISAAVIRTLNLLDLPPLHGKKIGITVGSRKIDGLIDVLKTLNCFLRGKGAFPFIIPAMGSHGGATADGQRFMLAGLGIDDGTTGMPVISDMSVVQVGVYPNGLPIFCAKTAVEADYIIVLSRVKAHTSIKGEVESGLCKMAVVGLGKHLGAINFHKQGYHKLAELLPNVGNVIFNKVNTLFGLALIENAYDRLFMVEAIPPSQLVSREKELLLLAKNKMSRFFLDEIDVLIVDRFGKDISGAGLDPNITGRSITPLPITPQVPIRTIVALNLTDASHGNATGIGGVDITTQTVIKSIDAQSTYVNAFTSGALSAVKLPIILANDEDAIRMAIRSVPCNSISDVKVVHILDTLHLGEIEVSSNYIHKLSGNLKITLLDSANMKFDNNNKLISNL